VSGPLQTGFQGVVNNQPAPAVAGDFFGANPRASVLGGAGQWVAPFPNGLTVGNFAWANQATGVVSQSYPGAGSALGFCGRNRNIAVIINFLAPATMQVQPGAPLTLHSEGDFWAEFAGGATPGQKVWANPTTGAPIAAATAPTIETATASAGATLTASIGSTSTGTSTLATVALTAVTGYVSVGDTLTDGTNSAVILSQVSGTTGGAGTYDLVAAPTPGAWVAASLTGSSHVLDATVVTGLISVGDAISGSGITTENIVNQISGTAGGIGLYTLSGAQQEHASEAMTDASTVLDVTAVSVGPLVVGDVISGSGVTSGTAITGQISGTVGGIGLYTISVQQEFASTAISGAAIATPWIVNSVAAAGELATISTWG
jgi:hypothetical protein